MLTFALESVEQCWPDVLALATQHWEGTATYRRHEPFNPSFTRYRDYNQAGYFRLFTARDGERLVGYFGIYLTTSMHSQLPMATEDTLFLHPDYRGGRNAIRFIRFVEAHCKDWGIHEIIFSCEIDNETGIQGLLKRLDYRLVIVQFSKLIDTPCADSAPTSMESTHVGTLSPS